MGGRPAISRPLLAAHPRRASTHWPLGPTTPSEPTCRTAQTCTPLLTVPSLVHPLSPARCPLSLCDRRTGVPCLPSAVAADRRVQCVCEQSATLGTSPAVHAEHAYATLTELLAATRTGTAATEQRHTFVPGSDAPHLSLPAGRTDVQLRKVCDCAPVCMHAAACSHAKSHAKSHACSHTALRPP
jgi:hypothetical protein